MKKLLSMTHAQKLVLCVILLGLIPTIGVLVWGVAKAVQSPELEASDWAKHPPTPTPAVLSPESQDTFTL